MKRLIFGMTMAMMILTSACNTQKKTQDNAQAPREQRQQRQGPPSIDEIFKMDTNLDGKLSMAEVKGPLLTDFAKIDKDGDGFLSKTEVQSGAKPKGRKGQPRQ